MMKRDFAGGCLESARTPGRHTIVLRRNLIDHDPEWPRIFEMYVAVASPSGRGTYAGKRPRLRTWNGVYTYVYTCSMATRAKIFQNGGSQAVRLPKSCRFPDEQQEVLVRRVGRKVVLEPLDDWPQEFLLCLGAWPEDVERPKSAPLSKIRDPFE